MIDKFYILSYNYHLFVWWEFSIKTVTDFIATHSGILATFWFSKELQNFHLSHIFLY